MPLRSPGDSIARVLGIRGGVIAALAVLTIGGCATTSTPTTSAPTSTTTKRIPGFTHADLINFAPDNPQWTTQWPLTDKTGVLRCASGNAVTWTVRGTVYALNGTAKTLGYANINPIWRADPTGVAPKLSLGPLISLGLTLCSVSGGSSDASSSPCANSCAGDDGVPPLKATEAFDICKQYVSDRLKSPSGATWRDPYGSQVTYTGSGDGPWTVNASVDSENSFGAKLRSTYTCTVKHESGDTWSLVNLTVNDGGAP